MCWRVPLLAARYADTCPPLPTSSWGGSARTCYPAAPEWNTQNGVLLQSAHRTRINILSAFQAA
jgi:hypothetical protein